MGFFQFLKRLFCTHEYRFKEVFATGVQSHMVRKICIKCGNKIFAEEVMEKPNHFNFKKFRKSKHRGR